MQQSLWKIAQRGVLALTLASMVHAEQPSLTVYNGGFAAVREKLPLTLKGGVNEVRYSDATRMLEPASVILRDPAGKVSLQILEQSYRNDPVNQGLLLELFEGQTIAFQTGSAKDPFVVQGKILRSGYPNEQPLIEVDGKLQFQLPGIPLFPALPDSTVLKPQLNWLLRTPAAVNVMAEIAYITGGLSWNADYNLVAEDNSDTGTLLGWVTVNNQSGRMFQNARLQLMAGDVNKIVNQPQRQGMMMKAAMREDVASAPAVTEKSFDEFHLYTVANPTTLLDKQIKQVEFVRSEKVLAKRIYVYDGAQNYFLYEGGGIQNDPGYGATNGKTKVDVYREFMNTKENGLGIALPAGRVRLYMREGTDGALQFTGENNIDHTPQGEKVRLFTGNSFDLVGERKQTDFKVLGDRRISETFEIKLRNRKKVPAEVRTVEHLYRGTNWKLTSQTDPYKKTNSRTIEFVSTLQPDEEKVMTYTVEYRW